MASDLKETLSDREYVRGETRIWTAVHGEITGRHTSAQVSAFKQVVPVRCSGYTFLISFNFARSNAGIVGLNPTRGADVCVYSVCRQRSCDGLIPRPRSPIDCV
jgi:hypothetical protein